MTLGLKSGKQVRELNEGPGVVIVGRQLLGAATSLHATRCSAYEPDISPRPRLSSQDSVQAAMSDKRVWGTCGDGGPVHLELKFTVQNGSSSMLRSQGIGILRPGDIIEGTCSISTSFGLEGSWLEVSLQGQSRRIICVALHHVGDNNSTPLRPRGSTGPQPGCASRPLAKRPFRCRKSEAS
jgi:hypothetical protein